MYEPFRGARRGQVLQPNRLRLLLRDRLLIVLAQAMTQEIRRSSSRPRILRRPSPWWAAPTWRTRFSCLSLVGVETIVDLPALVDVANRLDAILGGTNPGFARLPAISEASDQGTLTMQLLSWFSAFFNLESSNCLSYRNVALCSRACSGLPRHRSYHSRKPSPNRILPCSRTWAAQILERWFQRPSG